MNDVQLTDNASRRIAQFDGLRALAFIAVFSHHALKIPLLWMGVDLFFVLSGFLITANLLRSADTCTVGSSIRVFFFRRLIRIAPPYFLTLALVLAISLKSVPQGDIAWYVAFASNIRDVFWPALDGPLNSMWSVAVEEQFYLLWPLMVLFIPRRWLPLCFVALVPLAAGARLVASGYGVDAVYRLMPCRMDLLAAGALLAWVDDRYPAALRRFRFRLVVVAFLSLAVFAGLALSRSGFRTSKNTTEFNILGFALLTLLFASVIGAVRTLERGLTLRFLNLRPLQWLGMVSYGCYLIHLLALELVGRIIPGVVPRAAAGFVLTLLVAALSWRFIERPLQRLKNRVRFTRLGSYPASSRERSGMPQQVVATGTGEALRSDTSDH